MNEHGSPRFVVETGHAVSGCSRVKPVAREKRGFIMSSNATDEDEGRK
jgi:hypothetical protein